MYDDMQPTIEPGHDDFESDYENHIHMTEIHKYDAAVSSTKTMILLLDINTTTMILWLDINATKMIRQLDVTTHLI